MPCTNKAQWVVGIFCIILSILVSYRCHFLFVFFSAFRLEMHTFAFFTGHRKHIWFCRLYAQKQPVSAVNWLQLFELDPCLGWTYPRMLTIPIIWPVKLQILEGRIGSCKAWEVPVSSRMRVGTSSYWVSQTMSNESRTEWGKDCEEGDDGEEGEDGKEFLNGVKQENCPFAEDQ